MLKYYNLLKSTITDESYLLLLLIFLLYLLKKDIILHHIDHLSSFIEQLFLFPYTYYYIIYS